MTGIYLAYRTALERFIAFVRPEPNSNKPMNRRIPTTLAAALILGCATIGNAQSLLTNGSFESYGGFGNSNFGNGITGWDISADGGIDIAPYAGFENVSWKAAEGDVSISLNWVGPASVSQGVTTTPGLNYDLRFFMAAEIYGGQVSRTLDVLWNGSTIGSASFDYTGQGPTTMGWTEFSFLVVGTGSDLLTFQSTTPDNFGPTLDNVSLIAVPEPAEVTAAAAGLIAVWAIVGRRRRLASGE